MSEVTITKGSIHLSGLLFQPSNASPDSPALIIVHPGGGVKEQTASLYAKKLLNDHNLTTICFDASHQGASGGEPRYLEDPNARISDIWSVVDYLESLDTVHPDKIGILGICAGGGYAVAAAKADKRLKSVATVSMVNIGDSARYGWYGQEPSTRHRDTLEQVARQIRAEGKGAEYAMAEYVPGQVEEDTPVDLRDAHEYYLTKRGQHPRAQNKMLLRSVPRILTFDAFHLADEFLKQPTLVIAGETAGSRWHTEKLDKLIGKVTEGMIVPKAMHVDFYDKEEFVNPAVLKIAQFMKARLT